MWLLYFVVHTYIPTYLDLRFGGLFLWLTFFPGCFFPKAEQHPNADTLGDGGSSAGDTLPVFRWWRMAPPSVLIGFSPSPAIGLAVCSCPSDVIISLACSPCGGVSPFWSLACWLSSAMRRSSQTIPEEPCRRKEMVDLWRPAIDGANCSSSVFVYLSHSVLVVVCVCLKVGHHCVSERTSYLLISSSSYLFISFVLCN